MPVPPRRDPLANFERMRREIDELFGDVFAPSTLTRHRRTGFTPEVDVSYADDPPRAVVVAALPGVASEDVAIEVQGRQLVISGQRRPASGENRVYQQVEIEHGPFRRVIALGADVDAAGTRATYEDGMLRVELPLSRPAPARSVPIEGPGPEGGRG